MCTRHFSWKQSEGLVLYALTIVVGKTLSCISLFVMKENSAMLCRYIIRPAQVSNLGRIQTGLTG